MLRNLRNIIIGLLGALFLRLLSLTWRWEIRVPKGYARPFFSSLEAPYICSFWHSDQLVMPVMYLHEGGRRSTMTSLSSQHRDGRIMASALRALAIRSVEGSSTRGGVNGFRNLLKVMRKGSHVTITPDGPRGPVGVVKPGILLLAALSGARILPISIACSREWRFSSWDKMLLPKPFARVVVMIGSPISIPRELSDETQTEEARKLENSLHQLASDAKQCLKSMQP